MIKYIHSDHSIIDAIPCVCTELHKKIHFNLLLFGIGYFLLVTVLTKFEKSLKHEFWNTICLYLRNMKFWLPEFLSKNLPFETDF